MIQEERMTPAGMAKFDVHGKAEGDYLPNQNPGSSS
jgi:hypothetical protein